MERGEVRICGLRDPGPLYRALEAEARQPAPGKGKARIRVEGGCLAITIEAVDLSGLRAIMNSYLLLLAAAYSALEAGGYYK